MKSTIIIENIRSAVRELIRQVEFNHDQFLSIAPLSQCFALVELDAQKITNIAQLSSILNLEKSTTSRLVAQLVAKKLCTVKTDKLDRRNRLISLTPQGSMLVTEIRMKSHGYIQQALDTLNAEEIETVLQGFALYTKALQTIRPRTK